MEISGIEWMELVYQMQLVASNEISGIK